ncbi:glycoside hydrolase family 1 protein [Microterricola viridarii]|nr:family 1 glycosylhydrolase [Microterricola viridarii]
MSNLRAPQGDAGSARHFPADFLFGAATAAGQSDGAADDVALMSEIGLQAYRFSSSWARVCPSGGPPEPRHIDAYSRLVDELLSAGVMPWLTLYRGELPQPLAERGGWANRDTAHRFADYASGLHAALGDRVPVWLTLGEPWGPGGLDLAEGPAAPHHRLLAHGLAAEALREQDSEIRLGVTLNLTAALPADPRSAGDLDAARRVDAQFNRASLDPIFRASYPEDFLEDAAGIRLQQHVHAGDLEKIAQPIDLLGVNYYLGATASEPAGAPPTPGVGDPTRMPSPPLPWSPLTAIDWAVRPDGLRETLVQVEAEYTGPAHVELFVTENGAVTDDTVEPDGVVDDAERTAFLRAHLGAVLDAEATGVDVRGYFYCSLLDTAEAVQSAEGCSGLVHLDQSGRRTLKRSGSEYRHIIAARALSA